MATSSVSAVSSSSSRVRSRRSRRIGNDLGLRPSVDEDDEAEAEALLIAPVQLRELGQHRRIVVEALLGRRSRRKPVPLPDRGMRVERRELLVLGQRADDLVRVVERILDLRQPLDERRAALEELLELVYRQLPR